MRRKSLTTKTIHAEHWEPHECVVVRSLNTEDDEHIQDGLASIDNSGNTQIHAGRLKRLTLQRAIVSWTLTDEHGQPLPLNEQNIKSLANEDSNYIFSAVQALNAPMLPEEKKDSSMPATPGTQEKAK
jgi:hypothetical protein